MEKDNNNNLLVRGWHLVRNGWRRFKSWYKGLYRGRPWWAKTLIALATLVVCIAQHRPHHAPRHTCGQLYL